MCGIAGILCPPNAASPVRARLDDELARLASALGHRGPDAHGSERVGDVGLVHTRLAIIDLSPTGAQPMWSPSRGHLIAYNGEVYNFPTLRAELEARGERFAGTSDTEVVLRLLVTGGESALARLDGMFALALLDGRGEELLLARDRAGQKPLYLARIEGGGWAFASELAPLLRVPGVDLRIDPQALSHLLTFGFVPAPFSLRRGIRQLEPGSFVRLRAGAEPVTGRFAAESGPAQPTLQGDVPELAKDLEAVLSDCVREHLVSDVPVGVLLSGGVDSSTVAALAARHAGRVKTFAVVHRAPAYDERDAARAVAEHIGSEHHEIELSDAPLHEEELDTVVDHHGDPFADSSSLNVLRLSREMRRHVTVALSGDGGDEVFAGYPRFALLRLLEPFAHLPAPLLRLGRAAFASVGGLRGRQVARTFHAGLLSRGRRMVAFTSLFWPDEQARVLRAEWLPSDPDGALDAFLRLRGCDLERDVVGAAHWMEQRLILPDDMLTKVDRMSMSTALEVRPPLLAGPVLDFASRLPLAAKHRGRTGKLVLRTVAKRLVPPWVIDRPKKGFALPLEEHGGAVFRDAFRFAVESDESPLREIFRAEALTDLAVSLRAEGEGRDPEDSPYRRVHRRWLVALLARTLARQGSVSA
jgi:asparagine synthase (glutamine-hydrolysing)